jgi:hypothetical protein
MTMAYRIIGSGFLEEQQGDQDKCCLSEGHHAIPRSLKTIGK